MSILLGNYNDNEITLDLCYKAIQNDSYSIKFVPDRFFTEELCLEAITNYPEALLVMHYSRSIELLENAITNKVYMKAVQINGKILEYVPLEKRTLEICITAIKQDIDAIISIPKHKINNDIILIIINHWKKPSYLAFIPNNLIEKLSNYLIKKAIEYDGNALQFIPYSKKTTEICELAINQNGIFLEFVPNDKKTLDLCIKSVSNNHDAIEFVPVDKIEKIYNNFSTNNEY